MWRLEGIDRASHIILQVYVDDELVGSLQFWNDKLGKERIKLWQEMITMMNERLSHKR